MKHFNLFIPITKVDLEKRLVYGIATAEKVDKSGEIMDYASTVPYYKQWSGEIEKASGGKSLGNLREMHTNIAAGKVTQINFNDDLKQIEICAKVVDDSSWNKVVEGVLTGFSHGGAYVKTWKDKENSKLTRYTADPSEISIVDNPCLGEATFEVIKADGTSEMRKFKNIIVDEPATDPKAVKPKAEPEQVWKATDGQTFAKKADWEKHQLTLEAQEVATGNPGVKAVDDLIKALDAKEGKTNEPTDEELVKKKADRVVAVKTLYDNLTKFCTEAWDAKMAIDAICIIEDLICGEEWEAMYEGEEATSQIASLRAAIASLKTFVASEIMENADPAEAMEMAAAVELVKANVTDKVAQEGLLTFIQSRKPTVEKAGARHSSADKGQLKKAMDALDEARDNHEDAGKAHGKVTSAHEGMRKCMSKMADCMKALPLGDLLKIADDSNSDLLPLKQAYIKAEEAGMKGHMDEMEDHLDKADKHHTKVGKAHDGMEAAHDTIGHSLKAVGASNKDEDDTAEKTVIADLKKRADELDQVKTDNEKLLADNAEMKKALAQIPELVERVQKLAAQPLPAKGALYDPNPSKPGVAPVEKGHEDPKPDDRPAEATTSSISFAASPAELRARMNLPR